MAWPNNITYELGNMRGLLDLARDAEPIDECILFNGEWREGEQDRFGTQVNVIYVFEEIGGDPANTIGLLRNYKDAHRDLSFPRINEVNDAGILYVGSSQGSFNQRLNQHRGGRAATTHALRLNDWFGDLRYQVHLRIYDVEAPVLQIIEDSIAQNLRPMFGKQGGNGRKTISPS